MTRFEKLLRIFSHPQWRRAWLQNRVAATAEHQAALSRLDCASVVDIGANRGQFSLAARRCFPAARIHAFEPLPEAGKTFQRVHAGADKTHLHFAAIARQEGEATLHVSGRDVSSSLLPITSLQNQLFPGTAEVGTQKVPAGPLSTFLTPDELTAPALLKLDVQGFELEALRGCEDLLGYFAHVYAECSFVELYAGQALADEIIGWIRERSFALRGVYNMSYGRDGTAIQADFLFTRCSH